MNQTGQKRQVSPPRTQKPATTPFIVPSTKKKKETSPLNHPSTQEPPISETSLKRHRITHGKEEVNDPP